MSFYLPFILANIFIGYFFGSLSWSIIIGKIFFKNDPRHFESKNAGATNSLRIYGKKVALIILLLDILKTMIPLVVIWAVTKYCYYDNYVVYVSDTFNPLSLVFLSALFSIVGHCYPIFFRFKGGKGASTYGGLMLLVSPFIGLLALLSFILLIKKWKMVSLAVLIIAFLYPFFVFIPAINYCFIIDTDVCQLAFIDNYSYFSFCTWFVVSILATTIIFIKHKDNIKRIVKGNERRVGNRNCQ